MKGPLHFWQAVSDDGDRYASVEQAPGPVSLRLCVNAGLTSIASWGQAFSVGMLVL
jgi:hypothetical protein